jgi:acylphosphatase
VLVSGRVQGVGFRWWATTSARELDLVGSATNLLDGRVEVVAEGSRESCEQLVRRVLDGQTPGRVTHVDVRWEDPQGLVRFAVG